MPPGSLLVGYSLIFQVFLPQFRRVATQLRVAGIASHFTIGGHSPSLCHDEVLKHFPELGSVVRYEGEHTLVDLVDGFSISGIGARPIVDLTSDPGSESKSLWVLAFQGLTHQLFHINEYSLAFKSFRAAAVRLMAARAC